MLRTKGHITGVQDVASLRTKVRTDAHMSHEPDIPDIIALYALVGRMRILSSPRVVACAEKAMRAAGLDSMKEFGEIAREGLQAL
jgi:hypothetical protein